MAAITCSARLCTLFWTKCMYVYIYVYMLEMARRERLNVRK